MGLKCKHFNKIKKNQKKFKVASVDPGLCRQDPQKILKKIEKKIDFFFKVAFIDPGLRRQDLKKKTIFFLKVASANLVPYRTRLQSCSHRPCALTHRVYEGNFASFFFDFFFF
jgi:hypothetical protein